MIEGIVESIASSEIRGWAFSPTDTSDHLLIEAFARGALYGSAWANQARPDLAAETRASGDHGFAIQLGRPLTAEDRATVEVYATTIWGERALIDADRGLAHERGRSPGAAALLRVPSLSAERDGEVRLEVAVLIARIGWRCFLGEGWISGRGDGLPIHGFGVRAVDPAEAVRIEVKGFGASGRGGWIAAGEARGGGGRPLTGFAVRVRDPGFETAYRGRFARGGEIGPVRDGDACRSPDPDDLLTAMQVSVRRRPLSGTR
jgi:hypothetical protein